MKLFGLILAGGQSTRMHSDKSLIDYHGKPQRDYLHDLLKRYCDDVFLSCKNAADIPEALKPIVDAFHVSGPLNGILSAFQYNPNVSWIIVAVDMPAVDEKVIHYLIAHRDPKAVATCFFDSEGLHPEPLLTLWESHAAPLLKKFYEDGQKSPRTFLSTNPAKILKAPDLSALQNINTPEELQAFKAAFKHDK